MRVNIYAEELTRRVEVLHKAGFVGVRLFLELPASRAVAGGTQQVRGPFMASTGVEGTSAVTIWGKSADEVSDVLSRALAALHETLPQTGT